MNIVLGNRSINLERKVTCDYCNEDVLVWEIHEQFGLLQFIRKLPNKLKRCFGCEESRKDLFEEQQERLRKG